VIPPPAQGRARQCPPLRPDEGADVNARKRRIVGRERERGQALVEFALVLPLLATMLFATLQIGVAFLHYLALTDAVRAGARTGSTSRLMPDPVQATVASVRVAAVNLDQDELAVSVSSPWQRGADVTVTASYPYAIEVLGLVVKSGRLTSTTTERVE